ncbi:MAG TPA: hypothetical protein VG722_04055 [Tepidisphaeraceae bacterium]|nr:hypothetical protein [Tepidisphaeraceae bacterium]
MKWICYSICLGFMALLAGCTSSPYVEGYYFTPRPAVKDIPATHPSQPPEVSTYATAVGIRVAEKKMGMPQTMEIRLRIDNNGSQMVKLDPQSMQLTTSNLTRFPKPIIHSDQPIAIKSGDSALVTAWFPFPQGKSYEDFDLQTLILRWVLDIGGKRVSQTAHFHREYPRYIYYGDPNWPYYDPYWDYYPYPPGAYFRGTVIIHRHR